MVGVTSFSSEAWARNLGLYDAIRHMPFNAELAAGSLGRDAFQQYIVQDAHYLVAFAQALALAAAKSDKPTHVVQFAECAAAAIAVERELHDRYFQQFGLSVADVAAQPASPACHHYMAFLVATAFREPLPVLLAALLPCFWIYREVGRDIMTRASSGNAYRAWIETYGGEEFSAAVDRMIGSTDEIGSDANPATLDAMHRAFARATQLEWMFWDSAYRLEQWPVPGPV